MNYKSWTGVFMDAEKQEFIIERAKNEYEDRMENAEAQRSLAITSNLLQLGLKVGKATEWFDASVVEDLRMATRITRTLDGSTRRQEDTADDKKSRFFIEVGATTSTEYSFYPDDPNLYSFNFACVEFTHTPIGFRAPEIKQEDRVLGYNSIPWDEVEFTIQRAIESVTDQEK